jgi:hypothetical protein
VKKTILAVTAAAFVGGIALAPTPASALLPLPIMYAIFKSKEDKNFHAVNPYAKRVSRHAKHHKKM